MSFSTSLLNFIQIGPPSAEKMTSCRFSRWRISAILDFRGPIMGSLKSPCTTSYRSSIDTIALNCLVYEKIAFLHFGVKIQDGGSHNINLRPSIRLLSLYNTCIIRRTCRQTDGRTNERIWSTSTGCRETRVGTSPRWQYAQLRASTTISIRFVLGTRWMLNDLQTINSLKTPNHNQPAATSQNWNTSS